MADVAEVFNVLWDGTQGVSLDKREEGDAAALQNGLIGFAFKDASGNVVLPQLNAQGQLPVTQAAAGVCYYASGELAAGSLGLFADITGAEVDLVLEKTYSSIGMVFAATQTSIGQIVAVDDAGGTPVETVLGHVIVGAGQYTVDLELKCLIHSTVGNTGDQKLKIKGQNLSVASCMRASIAALEA